ncbi:unnamed protein product [Phaeothamnion confervicola]
MVCRTCQLDFEEISEQQAHFRNSHHLANLRRRLAGKPLLEAGKEDAEGAAADVAEDEEEDGSDASDDSAESDDDAVAPSQDWLMSRASYSGASSTGIVHLFPVEQEVMFLKMGMPYAFTISTVALERPPKNAGENVGDDGDDGDASADPWRCLTRTLAAPVRPLWVVIILRSGRFAGAVFEAKQVVCHKVMRRYTMRAKRGGAQSAYDADGRKPQSAGATLRR